MKSYKWREVLSIVNGKNQKYVENPNGTYPIYGSGGIIGYATDFLCPENSIILGRKGSINKPIFVKEKFWNVDTAFGIIPNKNILLPLFLYYFCIFFNFEKLNTTVTIPSLTKSNLFDITINIPDLKIQTKITNILSKIDIIIYQKTVQLSKLDTLVKSRFIEMFGDMLLNTKMWNKQPLESMADIVSGITKGRKIKGQSMIKVPYMAVSNVKDGYIDWTTVKTIEATEQEIEQYQLLPDDVLMTEGGDPDKLGRGAIIKETLENCIHQNHIFRVRLNESVILPVFFAEYLKHQKSKRYFIGCAKQTTGIASINMRQLKALPVLLPPLALQEQFAAFVEQVDKSKLAVKQSLEKLETLKKSLMQDYFG